MGTFIAKRLIMAAITVFLVVTFVFFFIRALPGDPIYTLVSADQIDEAVTEEQLDFLRAKYGLDKPVHIQYINYLRDFMRGNLGESFRAKTPVIEMIGQRLPVSIHLGLVAWILSAVISIPIGIICAVRRGTILDNVFTFLANIGITAPIFWVALILVYIFARKLGWLPVYGYTSPFEDFWLSTKQSIMPVFCLMLFGLASGTRQTRSSMLETRQQDYVRTAVCKGLAERTIIFRHMLKNALIPVVTLKGLGFTVLCGGQVLIEKVLIYPAWED